MRILRLVIRLKLMSIERHVDRMSESISQSVQVSRGAPKGQRKRAISGRCWKGFLGHSVFYPLCVCNGLLLQPAIFLET
jgi:hypothetical protein